MLLRRRRICDTDNSFYLVKNGVYKLGYSSAQGNKANGPIQQYSGYIRWNGAHGGNSFYFYPKIDFTPYTVMELDLAVVGTGAMWSYAGLGTNTSWYDTSTGDLVRNLGLVSQTARKIYTIDVSALTSSYWFKMYDWVTGTQHALDFYNIKIY